MDYCKIYWKLMAKAIARQNSENRLKPGFFEIHHIIPKEKKGNNKSYNLVRLTCREHIIAHLLLNRFAHTTYVSCGSARKVALKRQENLLYIFNSSGKKENVKNHIIHVLRSWQNYDELALVLEYFVNANLLHDYPYKTRITVDRKVMKSIIGHITNNMHIAGLEV